MTRLLDGMMRLVNFHLGGSLYAIPAMCLAGGPAMAGAMLFASACLTLAVYENLSDLAVRTGEGSLCRITSHALGRGFATALRALVVLNALGVVVFYGQACVDIYQGISSTSFDSRPSLVFWATLALGGATVPVLEHALPDVADWGSLSANSALLVLAAALFYLPPAAGDAAAGNTRELKSWWDMVVGFGPAAVFSFSSAEYVLYSCGVSDEVGRLDDKAKVHREVRLVGSLSLLVSLFIYGLVGLGGLRAFGTKVQDDILKNFALQETQHPALAALVLGTNAVSLVLSLPVFAETLLLYTRELLHDVLPESAFAKLEAHPLGEWLVNPGRPYVGCVWVIPLAALLAKKAHGLISIINLLCSCTDYAFMFVFPGLAFCALFRTSMRWACNLLLVMGAAYFGAQSFMQEWRS
mmetsp:Transcript_94926/g.263739  ORF Transcript_94926/g.263739 Transcript_94926/m.263739 type:complete len:411 (+) Transcript_94926:78-1310(+)